MFALTALDARPLKVNLKCDPDDALRLRAAHPDVIVPGWHMNKRHWNTVTADGTLPDRLITELVEDILRPGRRRPPPSGPPPPRPPMTRVHVLGGAPDSS
ncbi:hypothetical protein SALBM217S_07834 [Streptomyces griseoloalbus]